MSESSFKLSINLSKGTSSTREHPYSRNYKNEEEESSSSSTKCGEGNLSNNNVNLESFPQEEKPIDLISVNVPTVKNSRKRKQVITDFNSPSLLNSSTISAQQKEKERLERLRVKDNENDHLEQFSALQSYPHYNPLPVLDADDIDEITGFEEKYINQNNLPSTSKNHEIINLSSDDEDEIQELGCYPRVIDPRPIAKRQRWFISDKERAVRESMDMQHRIEQQRLKKRQHAGDIEQFDLTSGKLIVNRGHPVQDPDICVAPHLTHILQPHQLGGIRFMYDNIIESLEEYRNSPGFGCILAHSMGLGKTLQVITFIEIFFRATLAHRALVIVPVNTLHNWANEFEKWIPKNDPVGLNGRKFEVFVLGDAVKTFDARVNLLEQWENQGGVLIIGYDLFRLLVKTTQPKKATRMKLNFINGKRVQRDEQEDDHNKGYTTEGRIRFEANQLVRRTLLDPGPDLVVCDEGHKIKNLNTDIALALNSIKTTRRIVLTGYPLQNNLMEYYCMVDFVRPKYLGERKSFSLMFERPIKNGQCVDSTPGDVKLALQRTHVLVEMLKGFVQRRTHHLLKTILPTSKEYVMLLRKSPLQHALYRTFLLYAQSEVQKGNSVFNPLKAFSACSKIWNHPDVLANALRRRNGDKQKNDLKKQQQEPTLMDALNASALDNSKPVTQQSLWEGLSYTNDLDISDVDTADKPRKKQKKNLASLLMEEMDLDETGLKYDWAEVIMQHHRVGNIEHGYKMKIALDLIDETTRLGEKILLFSQNLTALDLMEQYLFNRFVANPDVHKEEFWVKNKNYFRLDGSTNASERERLVNKFNGDPSIRLFLISTRAGSLGINLVSANRCIILDACWNPCHDAQAVCRVYRYGQQRSTYIYRLIMDNSMERAIFNRQVSKHGLQQRVVDDAKVEANVTQKELETLLMYDEAKDVVSNEWDTSLWNIEDRVLATVVQRNSRMLSEEPFLHESLILEKEEGLSEQEKREAQLLYEKERAAEVAIPMDFTERVEVTPQRTVRDNFFPPPYRMMTEALYNNAMKATPFPNSIEAINCKLPNGVSAGGVTMAGAMKDISHNPHMRNPMQPNYYMNPHRNTLEYPDQSRFMHPQTSQWVPGRSFPGAQYASQVISSRSGKMQRIILDRNIELPLVENSSQLRCLPKGSEAVLVRSGEGLYLKAPNAEILNAEGSIFATGMDTAPEYFDPTDFRLPPPLVSRSIPEVIDLD